MSSEKKERPQDRYNKSHTVSVPNKAGYIKQLIRADMAKDK